MRITIRKAAAFVLAPAVGLYSLAAVQASLATPPLTPVTGRTPAFPRPALLAGLSQSPAAAPIAIVPGDLSEFSPPVGTIHPNLESTLSQLIVAAAGGKQPATLSRWQAGRPTDDRLVTIVETDPARTAEIALAIQRQGLQVQGSYSNLIQVQSPVTSLVSLASMPGVQFVRRPYDFVPQALQSEGLRISGALPWHNGGFRGQGTKIAVMDLGFYGYRDLMGTELPANLRPISFIEGLPDIDFISDHGTAAAEIVHDIAPDAQLYLVTISTEVELAKAVEFLLEEKVQVVSFSLGVLTSPLDGTGVLDGIVNKARAQGLLWVCSSGNYGAGHWSGVFNDANGDGWHEFAPDMQMLSLEIGPDEPGIFMMQWDDWPRSKQDYGVYLFWEGIDGKLQLMAFSDSAQNGTQPPFEQMVGFGIPRGKYYVAIKQQKADKPSTLHLFALFLQIPGGNPASSVVSPATAHGSVAVGATNGFDQLQVYSSRGPTIDGRIKPDFVAPDAVTTATYGKEGFPGTSASAPYVAGISAVTLSAYPKMGPDELQKYLEQHALRIQSEGKNSIYGAGRVRLPLLPNFAPQSTSTPVPSATPTGSPQPTATNTRTPRPGSPTATTTPRPTVAPPSPTGVSWPDHFRFLPLTTRQEATPTPE